MINLRIKITILQRTYKSYSAMKKYLTPAIVLLGFFVLIYAILASTDRSTGIALFGVLVAAIGCFARRMIVAK